MTDWNCCSVSNSKNSSTGEFLFFHPTHPCAESKIYLIKKDNKKVSFRCYPFNSSILKFSKAKLKNKLIKKELDDDCETDDEILKDSVDYMFEEFKKSFKKENRKVNSRLLVK